MSVHICGETYISIHYFHLEVLSAQTVWVTNSPSTILFTNELFSILMNKKDVPKSLTFKDIIKELSFQQIIASFRIKTYKQSLFISDILRKKLKLYRW